ncbi:MAG: GNAT family N-acetyltransferase [Actinobacteria bacterium]|nr:GNAT family N-acetyltransferase [Actinomycetota bacterium]
MLSAELITEVSKLGPFVDRWRELAVARSNAFVTPEWFHSWWTHLGKGFSIPLVAVARREGGEVVGVTPLVLDSSSRPQAIRFAGASLGDRFHPAAVPEDEAEIATATIAALEANGFGRQLMLFERADSDATWCQALQRSARGDQTVIEQQRTINPYIDLRGLDWDHYMSSRSQKFRKRVRRADRVLLEEHEMVLRPADMSTVTADMSEMFRLHDLRRDSLGGSSLDAASRRALHAFAVAASERGWLRLSALEANGRQIASFFGWRVGDTYASYQGGFDPSWSDLGVGFAIETMTIRQAIEEGASEYDFLLGAEEWKQRFTDLARPSQTLILVGARNPVRLLVAAESGLRRASAGISQRPALSRVVKAMHSVIPTVRRA